MCVFLCDMGMFPSLAVEDEGKRFLATGRMQDVDVGDLLL